MGYAYDYILVADRKTQNTAGGTFTQAGWRDRTLNTEVHDTAGIASLASNILTVPAGTYIVRARAPAYKVNGHIARINDTTSTQYYYGTSAYAAAADACQTDSWVFCLLTLTVETALKLQHYCNTTNADDGFGIAANITTETYSTVELWRRRA